MKTREQVLEAVENGKQSECLDGRDFSRLVEYFPVSEWHTFGFALKESVASQGDELHMGPGSKTPEPKAWTEEAILADLASDLDFAFEKALGKRGISASLMHSVIQMWLWVLDDPLQYNDDYANYGLPLLKAVALKYNLPDPLGEDSGKERQYSTYD